MKLKHSINEQSFIYSSRIGWESADDGVSRKILGYDDHIMMVCIRFEKGAVGTLHHIKFTGRFPI